MLQIQNWTNNTDQTQIILMPDGSQVTLSIHFSEQQQGWFITNLVWNTTGFTVTGLRITNNVNLLLQWQNLINFGLACTTIDGREPALLQDFSSGSSILYTLDSTDVAAVNSLLAGTA